MSTTTPSTPSTSLLPRGLSPALSLALACTAVPARALAGPADADDPLISPRLEIDPRLDLPEPDPGARLPSPLRAPIWLALDASLRRRDVGDVSFGAMLMLGLPLERLAARDHHVNVVAEGPSDLDIEPEESAPPEGQPSEVPSPDPPPPALKPPPRVAPKLSPAPPGALPPLRIPVVVTPRVARGAVDAALRRARLSDPDARFDAMGSRVRSAAALPELRLRVLRTIDQGQALTPTEYDPTRTTATDGSAFWMEARATWRLDRLIFANEEVALERMRHSRNEARTRLAARVLKLLFEWQRALAHADNPAASPEENLVARLKVIEAEAEIDLLTDGWFSRWRAAPAAP